MIASEIMQAACARIDEADPANPISVSNTEVLSRVNEGYLLASFLTLVFVKTVAFNFNGCWNLPRPSLTDLIVPLRIMANGVRLRPSTLSELDAYNPAWQTTPGQPARYAAVGSNLLAITPQQATLAQITYAYSPLALQAADPPLLPPAYHSALVEYTTYRIRLKEGAQQLARGLGNLNVYLDAIEDLGSWVRARSAAAHYDVTPFEMALFDRSKLITDIVTRQNRAAAKAVK